MEDIEKSLLEQMATVDLFTTSSPYLSRTFAVWRADLFSKYNGPLSDFISVVDSTYLPKFLKRITHAYHDAIEKDPLLSEIPRTEENFSEIVRILTE